MPSLTQKLSHIYYNMGEMGGFSGIPSIMKNFKKTYPNTPISSKIVQNFLNLQTPYSLHQKRFKKLSRNMTYAPRVNTQWTADLIDFPDFKRHNDGYRYVLVVIDCLSRFVYTEPIKTKSADDVVVAFEKIFKRAEHLPVVLNSDEGNEFRNKKVIALFKKHNIHSFVSFGDVKGSQAERVIRTLKEILFRYFDHTLARRWLEILPKVTRTYNANINRSIKMSPVEAQRFPNNVLLSEKVMEKVQNTPKKPTTLKKGDWVRLNLNLGAFAKSYEAKWSRALYKIYKGPYYTTGASQPMFGIADYNGKKIAGGFLPREIKKVSEKTFIDEYKFPIAKVVKRGKKFSVVSWLGYDNSHDSRIPNSEIRELAKF